MKLKQAGERKVIELIKNSVRKTPLLKASFDNDAAVFKVGSRTIAVSTDMGLGSTHFTNQNAADMGKKIAVSNVSDLYCTGAEPFLCWVDFGCPKGWSMEFVRKLYQGLDGELKKHGAFIAGGDTNESKEFVYSVAVLGEIKNKPLLRSTAKTGDCLVLSGPVGGAAAAYLAWKNKKQCPKQFKDAQERPALNGALCKRIMKRANAGIDISDGLARELNEIARLSKKKLVVDWEKLPKPKGFEAYCEKQGWDAVDVAFNHGEDYQVVYSTPDRGKGNVFGRVLEARKPSDAGVWLLKDGKKIRIPSKGWEHFRN
ncbi:MAG: thiamine-phosphate kinase [Candidatus Micrarchaeota archaeon]